MLERIKLFHNKNKNAGEAQNAELNIQKQTKEEAVEKQSAEQYEENKLNQGKEL